MTVKRNFDAFTGILRLRNDSINKIRGYQAVGHRVVCIETISWVGNIAAIFFSKGITIAYLVFLTKGCVEAEQHEQRKVNGFHLLLKQYFGGLILNPVHGHNQTTEKGRQAEPESFRKENGEQYQCNSRNCGHGPIKAGFAFLFSHGDSSCKFSKTRNTVNILRQYLIKFARPKPG